MAICTFLGRRTNFSHIDFAISCIQLSGSSFSFRFVFGIQNKKWVRQDYGVVLVYIFGNLDYWPIENWCPSVRIPNSETKNFRVFGDINFIGRHSPRKGRPSMFFQPPLKALALKVLCTGKYLVVVRISGFHIIIAQIVGYRQLRYRQLYHPIGSNACETAPLLPTGVHFHLILSVTKKFRYAVPDPQYINIFIFKASIFSLIPCGHGFQGALVSFSNFHISRGSGTKKWSTQESGVGKIWSWIGFLWL